MKFFLAIVLALVALVAASNPEGLAFLEENKKKEGVITTDSGLQYKVIKQGPAGGKSPEVSTKW
jgi:FKBP-type peptidyl-prolyl cis-trans isomerase FklB